MPCRPVVIVPQLTTDNGQLTPFFYRDDSLRTIDPAGALRPMGWVKMRLETVK